MNTDKAKIESILKRGVEEIFVYDALKKKLEAGQELRVKFGVDPTGPKIHLGRAVVLRKLRAFQELGHKVVLIVGDFTARIGDPSDKLGKRPMLTPEDIQKNLEHYVETLGKIIDLKRIEVHHNSEWLGKLGFAEISELAESFSVQQMSNRRNFKDRLDRGEDISLREFLYPLMQGYDSVAVKADVELGGSDQLFNLKAGRIIQRHYGEPEQDVLTCQMLEGTDGRKMSTSWGNVINITDEPSDMYGKVMSLRDELITKYFLLCTDVSETEIEAITQELKGRANPRDLKMKLAREIVKIYHSEEAAKQAEEYFVTAFQKGELPEQIDEVNAAKGEFLSEVLLRENTVKSKTELRRLMDEGAVTIWPDQKVDDINFVLTEEVVLKIGKKRFLKIKV